MKLFSFIFAFGAFLFHASARSQVPPNIVLIIADDLRPQLGCYGFTGMTTPNMDQLAKEGVIFQKAFAQQALCGPSRASLLTGRRPDQTRIYHNRNHFRGTIPDVVTLPQYFKTNGYHTQAIGKVFHNQLLDDKPSWSVPSLDYQEPDYGPDNQAKLDSMIEDLKRRGNYQERYIAYDSLTHQPLREVRKGVSPSWISWEMADEADENLVDGKLTSAAISAIQQLGAHSSQPFFLAIGLHKPHLPYVAPRKYFDLYPLDQIEVSAFQVPHLASKFALHPFDELREYSDIPDEGELDTLLQKQLIRAYYACISYTDAQIGRILHALKSEGLYDNTIVVVMGDHGYHLGDQGQWTKQTNFDWATRAPLIIKPAGKTIATGTSDAFVEFVDIYPTLCELALLPAPHQTDGLSFARLLYGKTKRHKRYAFSQYPRKKETIMGYSVRSDKFRYTEWINFDTREVLQRELYDYRKSETEIRNEADNPHLAKVQKRLKQQLMAYYQVP